MFHYRQTPQDSSLPFRFRTSISLFIVFCFFTFANSVVFITAQLTNTVSAQEADSSELIEPASSEPSSSLPETVKAAQASVTPEPAQTPRPVTAHPVAKKPVPTYDRVAIPSIGLSSRYVPVGVTTQNNIDVHPSLVGLYTGGAQPGDIGAVFLDGHNPGVFSALPSIDIGAQITLTKANGEIFTYTVVHTETVSLVGINMRKALRPYDGATEGLNVMTCVGAYNPQTGTTDERFVVYAVRS